MAPSLHRLYNANEDHRDPDDLDVPDCSCNPFTDQRVCTISMPPDGCEELQRRGKCGHAFVPRRRGCVHVLAADHDMPMEEWAARIHHKHRRDRDSYDDPPPPASPTAAATRAAKVEVMRQRAERRPGHEAEGLWHDGDLDPTEGNADAFERRISTGRNGRVKVGDLVRRQGQEGGA